VAGNDGSGLLLIAGDAGIGKTRLLAEVARQAQERWLLVLAGGSYQAEGRLPLGAFHDALLDYVESQSDEVLQLQIGGLLPALQRVVPELRTRFPGVTEEHMASLEDQRLRIFWTITRVFKQISEIQPLVLLLDDLHWADETTLQLLHYLTRQPGLNQMLTVGVYRPGETATSEELDQLLVGRTDASGPHYLALPALHLSELATVLGHRLGGVCAPDLVRAVHQRSAGNPFFALEVVGLLQQEGRLEQHHDANGTVWTLKGSLEGDLPRAVRETVAQRLSQLAPDVLELLQLTSVIGRQVSYATLADLWEGGDRSLLRALDTAIAAQILEEAESGYAFRHPLLQEVVYRQLSEARRAWLHGRIAESLEHLYGSRADEHASELAHHVVAGGKDGERALRYLTLAAERSVRASAWREALTAYRTALQFANTNRTLARIQERIGAVLKALGRYDEALSAFEEAATRYERVSDLQQVGEVTAALVQVHALRGSWEQGRAEAMRVIDQIERLHVRENELSRILADLYVALTYLYDTGPEERLHEAEQAAELTQTLEDDGLRARAEMRRSFMLYALRRFSEAEKSINELIPLAERVRDAGTLRFAVDILADIHKLQGRFNQCLYGRQRALAYAEERPDEPHWIMVSLAQVAEAQFLLGNWPEARALYERALQMSRVYPAPHYAAFALLGLGELDLAAGHWEEATQLVETCMADAHRTSDVHWVRNAERLLAYRDLLRAQPDEALRRLEHAGEEHTRTLYLRAWGYLDASNVKQAVTTIDRCIAIAKQQNSNLDLCEAWIVRGRIGTRLNCVEEAEDSFREAVALARSMPYPFAEGRALFERGQMLIARGNREAAREPLGQALRIFQCLEARRCVEQAERSLGDRASAQAKPE
jgi:predicted ATPase